MKKVLLIGGGTGLSTISRVIKNYAVDLNLIVTVTDNGGSSGLLREGLNIPPPGDLRSNLIALADNEDLLTKLFKYRFECDELKNHSLGNLIIAGLKELSGSFPEAIYEASNLLKIKGRVLPATEELINLVARLKDGSLVWGEINISRIGGKIEEIFLDRKVNALTEAIDCIKAADIIIVGPGSVYTSIIPNFLIGDLKEMYKRSTAQKVFICNLMTQPGETDNFSLSQHVSLVEKYTGVPFDKIFYSCLDNVDDKIIERYKEQGAKVVENDLENDARVEILNGMSTVDIMDRVRKTVIRHSRKEIQKMMQILGVTGETV